MPLPGSYGLYLLKWGKNIFIITFSQSRRWKEGNEMEACDFSIAVLSNMLKMQLPDDARWSVC